MSDLVSLIEQLEAAEEGSRELDGDIVEVIGHHELARVQAAHLNQLRRHENRKGYAVVDRGEWSRTNPTRASWRAPNYTTSLDDAATLVPIKLGWMWDVACYGLEGAAFVGPRDCPVRQFHVGATAPLALAIAALKARQE